jgi:GH43 family beta-xylosidase
MFKLLIILLIVALSQSQEMFTNPILDGDNSADPCILRVGFFYYLTLSENGAKDLTIFKSPILTSFNEAEKIIAYSAPEGYGDLWASEMHNIDGQLFIYFTMSSVFTGNDHRMYAIQANDPNNPMAGWSSEIRYLILIDSKYLSKVFILD